MRVQELTKQYDGKTVVDGVSFAIPKGKVISLIGPNGAGKSTVMGMISRLIAHDSGLVDFEGKDIGKWKSKELSKRLAILTQSNNIQMKLTVRELVTFGRNTTRTFLLVSRGYHSLNKLRIAAKPSLSPRSLSTPSLTAIKRTS